MDVIDFFGSSRPRSAEERIRKIEAYVPGPGKRGDFLRYGYDYFDNEDFGVGYGGYHYDGRYAGSVDKMISHYRLTPESRVLELGCAKGFILFEFLRRGIAVAGIDISEYAVENALPEVRPFIRQGSCERLEWGDGTFDLVYSKETLPHLTETQLVSAIAEVRRVCRGDDIFLEIQVGNDDRACQLISVWDETHQTVRSSEWWRRFLMDQGYRGQVCFKALF